MSRRFASHSLLALVGVTVLAFAGLAWQQEPTASSQSTPRTNAQCSMHPWIKAAAGARCTLCGMNLVSGALCGLPMTSTNGTPVLLSEESVRITGIRTSEVKKRPLIRTLRLSGMIGVDESRLGIISAPVDCRVDGLFMTHEGQTVTQRQPLATIFSPVLLAAADDYKKALATAGEPLDRAKRRLEHYGLVWEQIKTIPERQPDDLYFGMLAPRSGTIVKSFVTEGQNVKAGQKMFEVADFAKMWFHALIPEQDVPFVKAGQIVKLRTATLPGAVLTSRIYNVSPNLDDMTRSARVRVILENPERKIKNNAFADGEVQLDATEVLTVPRSAVLWPGNHPRVYVRRSAGDFQPRLVQLGRTGDHDYEVLGGLAEGDHVVTSGAMLIDGQARLSAR
jgi:Cu(I)/Ag(I) efflux system membrane fusion protein